MDCALIQPPSCVNNVAMTRATSSGSPSDAKQIHRHQLTGLLRCDYSSYPGPDMLLELGGKRSSLLAHQTPLYSDYSRLNWCPDLLNHYKLMAARSRSRGSYRSGSLALLKFFQYAISHTCTCYFFRVRFEDISSAIPSCQYAPNCLLNAICRIGVLKAISQHHGNGKDCCQWICNIFTGNFGGRTMSWLI